MGQFASITTRGEGFETLKAYFELLRSPLPRKFPTDTADWGNGRNYDAPHGILTVWQNGRWEATFSLMSVAADIRGIVGLLVVTSE